MTPVESTSTMDPLQSNSYCNATERPSALPIRLSIKSRYLIEIVIILLIYNKIDRVCLHFNFHTIHRPSEYRRCLLLTETNSRTFCFDAVIGCYAVVDAINDNSNIIR